MVGLSVCVCVCVCVCISLSVCWSVSPAKLSESIQMPFVGLTRVRPRNRVLDGGPGLMNSFAVPRCDKIAVWTFVRILWPLVNYVPAGVSRPRSDLPADKSHRQIWLPGPSARGPAYKRWRWCEHNVDGAVQCWHAVLHAGRGTLRQRQSRRHQQWLCVVLPSLDEWPDMGVYFNSHRVYVDCDRRSVYCEEICWLIDCLPVVHAASVLAGAVQSRAEQWCLMVVDGDDILPSSF